MQSGEVFETLEGHLKSTDEIDLVVLRGHLILEQCLNAMLVQWIPAERLPKLNLNFARKLDLYAALQDTQQHWAEEIAHLHELNRIRNKLAHQLPSKPGHHADVKKIGMRGGGLFPEVDGSARDLPQHGAEGLLPPDRVSFRRRVNAHGDLGHGKPQVDQGPCFGGSKRVCSGGPAFEHPRASRSPATNAAMCPPAARADGGAAGRRRDQR